MKIPRILLAAGASGSGKTLITCGTSPGTGRQRLKNSLFQVRTGLH